jgi:hypothetical protein
MKSKDPLQMKRRTNITTANKYILGRKKTNKFLAEIILQKF